MYLDGEIKSKGDKGMVRMANIKYKDELLKRELLYERLIRGILNLIYEERVNEIDHMLLLKRMILMLEKLEIYNHRFYKEFIITTDNYYKEFVTNIFESSNISDYLQYIQKALTKEQGRIENYLSISSTRESIDKVELRMIKDIAEQIIEKGMKVLIHSNKLQDLSILYKLFKQVNLLNILEAGFLKVVKETGLNLVSPPCDEKTLIASLLDYREKTENIMQKSFENSIKFKYSNKIVWEEFINKNTNIGVLCAKDLDEHLIKNSKIKLTDQELENRIDGIINIFKYINSKDIFEAFYFKQLAKRQLLEKSKSIDLEKSVISKLKAECGATFISRLYNMQKDIDVSKTYMENFKQAYAPTIDFHV